MSKATPMPAQARVGAYLAQTGRTELTPAQRRQVLRKQNQSYRPHARVGRLRRRFDKVDQRRVKIMAAAQVAAMNMRKGTR
jgi:hypothetical protein